MKVIEVNTTNVKYSIIIIMVSVYVRNVANDKYLPRKAIAVFWKSFKSSR